MSKDNLDNFFNKKLNDFDAPSDGWDKLGEQPFLNAQADFPKFSKGFWMHPNTWLISVMGVAVVSLIIYTVYLNNEINTLKSNSSTEQITSNSTAIKKIEELNKVDNHRNLGKNSTADKTVKHNIQGVESISKSPIQTSRNTKQPTPLNDKSKKLEPAVSKSETNRKTLQKSTSGNSKILKEGSNEKVTNQQLNNKIVKAKPPVATRVQDFNTLELIAPKGLQSKPYPLSDLDIDYKKQPPSKAKHRFSVGYEYGFSNINMPYEVEFEGTDNGDRDDFNFVQYSSHGLMFNYELNDKWRILTGVRFSEKNLFQDYRFNGFYDKSSEYILPTGPAAANDLSIEQSTLYSKQDIDFTLSFSSWQGLDDGEPLSVHLAEEQNIEQLQIPIGIEYHFGEQPLKGFAQFGTQFNFIEIRSFDTNLMIQSNGEFININNLSKDDNRSHDKYLGIFGGLGLTYPLTNHWSIRGNLSYQLNFNRTDFGRQSNPQRGRRRNHFSGEQTARLGLNYQF